MLRVLAFAVLSLPVVLPVVWSVNILANLIDKF